MMKFNGLGNTWNNFINRERFNAYYTYFSVSHILRYCKCALTFTYTFIRPLHIWIQIMIIVNMFVKFKLKWEYDQYFLIKNTFSCLEPPKSFHTFSKLALIYYHLKGNKKTNTFVQNILCIRSNEVNTVNFLGFNYRCSCKSTKNTLLSIFPLHNKSYNYYKVYRFCFL